MNEECDGVLPMIETVVCHQIKRELMNEKCDSVLSIIETVVCHQMKRESL